MDEEVREEREEGAGGPGTAPEMPPEDAASGETVAEDAASTETPPEEAPSDEAVSDEAPSGDESPDEGAESPRDSEEPPSESPADEGEPQEQESEDRLRWYVVHTNSGHEERAAKNIERAVKQADLQEQVPRVLVPTESVAEMKNGKKTITDRKFFPSYVLVRMEMSDETWRVISNTPGVTRFVGVGTKPQPISDEEIERILGRIEGTKEKPTPTIPYHVGEHVKVTDGPFTEFTGVVDEIQPERGKLKVMVLIFGRPVPVELDFLQVKSL
ncbi:MAG: transcription termination/antitermination protein NusG [Candidatus Eisenbacteria bacterium]